MPLFTEWPRVCETFRKPSFRHFVCSENSSHSLAILAVLRLSHTSSSRRGFRTRFAGK